MFDPDKIPTIPTYVREALDAAEDAAVDRPTSIVKIRAARREADRVLADALRAYGREAYAAGLAAAAQAVTK